MTITAIAERFGVTYHTARADLRRLVDLGILREAANVHPRTFYAHEVMQIAYSDQQFEGTEQPNDDD
jgi:DeoR/GlpR family transcriptional regulator of sugar metabolism